MKLFIDFIRKCMFVTFYVVELVTFHVIQHYLADCILISLSCMLESERMFVYSCLLRDNLDAKSY